MLLPVKKQAVRVASRPFGRTFGTVCVLLGLVFLLVACGGSTNQTPTPTAGSVHYVAIPIKLPAAAYSAPTIGPLPGDRELTLGVTFKVNPNVLSSSGGKIPNGKNVDLSKIANEYGISEATYQQFKTLLGVQDITLNLGSLHSYMSVKGKVSSIEQVLQTQFILHKLNGREYYVPDPTKPPKLPAFAMNYIVAVTGLESYSTLAPGISRLPIQLPSPLQPIVARQQAADCTVDIPDAPAPVVLPQQIARAYDYDTFYQDKYNGTGVTVNLTELGGYSGPDLANYFACVGFPQSHFAVEDIIPPDPQPDADTTAEAMLDIEMIAGLAPGATIDDYEAAISSDSDVDPWQLLDQELQTIIDNNISGNKGVNIVSISLGNPEEVIDPVDIYGIDQALQTLVNAERMTVFIASGDCGAFDDGQLGDLGVDFPGSDPYATAVGGTELATDSQGGRVSEPVWGPPQPTEPCQNGWGSGGGVSQLFKLPKWQAGPGVTNRYTNGNRETPDVSAVADNIPVYLGGQWQDFAGTSAATPIWASGLALVEQALVARTGKFVYGPGLFYNVVVPNSHTNLPYFDVTQGDNQYYSATAGWDNATGWGAPSLVGFFNTIVSLLKS